MNRERAKELLPIMTAFAEGKIIEYRGDPTESWRPITDPSWGEPLHCYRIKPAPKMRPMTRDEILGFVTNTPGIIVKYGDNEPNPVGYYSYDDFVGNYEYARIDSSGNLIDGWHKFETQEDN